MKLEAQTVPLSGRCRVLHFQLFAKNSALMAEGASPGAQTAPLRIKLFADLSRKKVYP